MEIKKESPLLSCIELTVRLKRAISGVIFDLLLVFYYLTKITLGVLLALLYKRCLLYTSDAADE